MERSPSTIWTIALLVLVGLLSLLIYQQLNTGYELPQPEEQGAAPQVPEITDSSSAIHGLPPLEMYQEIIERPLFIDTRRPWDPEEGTAGSGTPEESETQEPMADELPPWDLIGVMISPVMRSALLWDFTKNEAFRMEEGAALEGWEVEQVHPDGIVLSRGPQQHQLELRDYEQDQPQVAQPPQATRRSTPRRLPRRPTRRFIPRTR